MGCGTINIQRFSGRLEPHVILFEELGLFIQIGILMNINFVIFEIGLFFLNRQRLDLRDPPTNLLL